MDPYLKLAIIAAFLVVDAIVEEVVNRALGVEIKASSGITKIISRTITLCAGGIIAMLITQL